MNKNEKGFGLVEGLLLVLVVSFIGFAGWYVFNENGKPRTSINPAVGSNLDTVKPVEPTNPEGKDELAGWKKVTNEEHGFSFKYPGEEGWTGSTGDSTVVGGADFAEASYTLCGKNCGLAFTMEIYDKGSRSDVGPNYVEQVQQKDNNFYKLTSKTPIDIDGRKGTKWVYSPAADTAAGISYYYFTDSDKSYYAIINFNGAKTEKTDVNKMGEKIFTTLSFN